MHDDEANPPCTLALDLGQAADFSALVILETTPLRANDQGETIKRHDCRFLKRWPLGTSYPAIVQEVAGLVKKLSLNYPPLIIDATGVGRPVVEMIQQQAMPVLVEPVLITAGSAEGYHGGFHHVAKMILISTLQVLLQQRRLRFARALPDVKILVRELLNYQVKITPAANEVFNACAGSHDDLVLSLALAAWHAERAKPFEVPIALPNPRISVCRNDPHSPFYWAWARRQARFR